MSFPLFVVVLQYTACVGFSKKQELGANEHVMATSKANKNDTFETTIQALLDLGP
jgi:hypothetical protein